jgi:hypothetical protein
MPFMSWYGKILKNRTGHRLQYDACALHSGYLRVQTRTKKMYFFLFHCNNGCTNAPECCTYSYSACIVYSAFAHFHVQLRQLFDLQNERRRFICKTTQEFYLALLRRLKNISKETTATLRKRLYSSPQQLCRVSMALSAQFLASNGTPVVICAFLELYTAHYISFLPTIQFNLSLPSSRVKQSRRTLKIRQRGCSEASVRNYHSTLANIPK